MNEDNLEAQKLEIMQELANCMDGKADIMRISDIARLMSIHLDKPTFHKVLDLLVKEHLVRYNRWDIDYKGHSTYELTEKAKTKYGISARYTSGYIIQPYEPPKYVNVVNSAGVIVDTREVMDKGTLRTILAGICIFTIIAIIVLIVTF